MNRVLILLSAGAAAAWGHDIITTPITFDREISRIIYTHCASCHHEGGAAFSLMTFKEARPWAVAIKEEVLARRMPPWGAVKGFGDFRNDQALTPEQLELIVSWTDGGVPEGEEKDLPALPKFEAASAKLPPKNELTVHGDFALRAPLKLDGIWPLSIPEKASFQMVAMLPDGSIQPLVWIQDYKTQWGHPFLLRAPLDLPKGTTIQGVPAGASIVLLKPVLLKPVLLKPVLLKPVLLKPVLPKTHDSTSTH